MFLNTSYFYSKQIKSVEFLRSLSLFGNNSFNTRFLNLNEILENVNTLLGFPIKESLLGDEEIEERVINFFLNKIELPNVSYQDIRHFISTSKNIRYHIKDSNELDAFKRVYINHKENKSLNLLKAFLENYFESLNGDIDIFIYAHKIIDYCNKNNIKVYEKISYFLEDNITPLEELLLSSIAKEVNEITIDSLFIDKSNSTKIASINPRYGIRNEIGHVLNDISKNNYPLGDCQIVLTNKDIYSQELYKMMNEFKINITYECGLPITLTDPYKLYFSLTQLEKKYFYDVNGYLNLFNSESFDIDKLGITYKEQVAQLLGRMKISLDKERNDIYLLKFNDVKENHIKEFDLFLEKIDRTISFNKEDVLKEMYHVIEEFSKGISYIIKEYSKNTSKYEDLFIASKDYITAAIDCAYSLLPEKIRSSYLDSIQGKYILKKSNQDDALYITTINKGFSSLRKHIYIVGLNASYYPGSLTEDFLFSDSLYEELCGINEITEKSLDDRNAFLKSLINTYLSLDIDLHLSYNAQEIKEVRELNPCSVLLDYMEDFFKEDELKDLKKKCSYYSDDLSSLKEISDTAINNIDVLEKPIDIEQIKSKRVNDKGIDLLNAPYSPSKIVSFMGCPFRFYLDNIVSANNEIEYDNLRPIEGKRFGDLLHYVFEHFVKDIPNASLLDVKEYATKLYDLYTEIDRSIGDDDIEKDNFIRSVENTYNFLTTNFDLKDSLSEEKVGYKKKSIINGIWFRGSIDLLTHDKEGNLVLIDYKTGRQLDHIQNDPISCIQALIYAKCYQILTGKEVKKIYFYYTRLNIPVNFDNPCSKENEELLNNIINSFKDSISKMEFDIANEEVREDVCKYCKYKNICHKDDIKKEETNDEE